MRLILKLIAAPFIVLLTVLVAVLLFLFSVSSFLLTAASVIMALAAWAGSPRTLLGQRTMSIAWAGLGVLSLLAAAGLGPNYPRLAQPGQPALHIRLTPKTKPEERT